MSSDEIKAHAHALANYKTCYQLALGSSDPAMANFYLDMVKESEQSFIELAEPELQQMQVELNKSQAILAKLNQHSLTQLCESRFDKVSRQYYQQQLQNQQQSIQVPYRLDK